jgi:hypothetical protein
MALRPNQCVLVLYHFSQSGLRALRLNGSFPVLRLHGFLDLGTVGD